MRPQVAEFAMHFREAIFRLFRLLSEVRGSEVRGPTVFYAVPLHNPVTLHSLYTAFPSTPRTTTPSKLLALEHTQRPQRR
jgi:hypothetical protein